MTHPRTAWLADALAQAPEGLGFALDTKDPGAAPATLAAVEQAEVSDRVLLWSQHDEAVCHYVARAREGTEVALLRDTRSQAETDRYFNDAVRLGATAVSVHQDVLDPALVEEAHDRGLGQHPRSSPIGLAFAVRPQVGSAAHRDRRGWQAERHAPGLPRNPRRRGPTAPGAGRGRP